MAIKIEANIQRGAIQRARHLFAEINPEIDAEEFYKSRWSDGYVKKAAVLAPVVARDDGYTLMLTVRSPDMKSHPGQISLPGGKIEESDESHIAAALREAHEEVNIPPESVDVLGVLGDHRGGKGFTVTPVIGIVPPDVDFQPCPREVDEIFEVPLSFLADLRNHVIEQREWGGTKYNMFAAPYEGYHIWGLTAGILRSLAETLQDEEINA